VKKTWEALMSVGTLKWMLVVGASIFAISAAFAQQSVTTQQGPRADLGKLWYVSNCATCHGLTGNGDGPMALYLTRKVPDLTTLARRNNGVLPVSEMYDVIVGQKQIPSHGSREMPVWGQEFREQGSKEHGVVVGDRYLGIFPFDEEAYVRARVLTIIEYINRIQVK
jgi:mono/diheme cytochrome c family protein